MNRLQKVTDWDGKTTSYEYDAAGRRTKTILPNGNNTSYNYDVANRLTDLTNLTASGTVSFNYSYDKAGNRISMTEADGKTTQYQYDPLYQLKKVVPSVGKTKEYSYDAVGNRLKMTETEGTSVSTTKYEYNGANELLQKIDPSGQTTQYHYDANGNRISKVGNQTTDQINKVLDDIESRIGLIAYIRIPLSNGGYVDVHGPHDSETGKYHGHEYDRKGNEKGSENADGSEHDGKNFTDKTKKELKNNKVWKTIKKRNERFRKDKDRSNYRMDAGEIGASALTISVSIIGIGIIIIGIIDPIPGPI